FLSRERQGMIAEHYGLTDSEATTFDYRDRSILDLFDETLPTQDAVVLLDEHYRSHPSIIEFSNRNFYKSSLRIMTQRPGASDKKGVILVHSPTQRDKTGTNRDEAQNLMTEVAKRIKAEKDLDPKFCHSLGILSPFRDQVDYLFRLVSQSFDVSDIEKHDLLVVTAYSFQGEE